MRYTTFIMSLLFVTQLFAQEKSINLACFDFTFEEKEYSEGQNLREIFEISVVNPKFPFTTISREDLENFSEKFEEEKILHEDYNNFFNGNLELAGVDFMVFGDVKEKYGTGKFRISIFLIKVTGENVTQKLPLSITVDKKYISDDEKMQEIFKEEIEQFVDDFFFFKGKNDKDVVKVPDFIEELEKRDSIIFTHEKSLIEKAIKIEELDSTLTTLESDSRLKNESINILSKSVANLQNENSKKNIEIQNLNKNISNVKDYSNIARLNIWGREFNCGGGMKCPESELSKLMDKIIIVKNDKAEIKSDSITLSNINSAIKINPKFPFSHYAKSKYLMKKGDLNWVKSANSAIKILEITTSIQEHKPAHKEALNVLRRDLTRLAIIIKKNRKN